MSPIQWQAERLWQEVVAVLPGFTVEIVPSIDSTNSELVRRARTGASEPILLVAEHQSAGRGRLGRDWFSDNNQTGASLTFSLGFTYAPSDWSGLSLAVGLSIAQTLHPALQLKWPNDIWFQGRKVAGILIETVASVEQRYVVVGVGINIAYLPQQALATPSASLQELRPGIHAAQTLAEIVPPLVCALQQFAVSGFAPLQKNFMQRDALYGQNIICSNNITGVANGVDTNGALLVHTAQGVLKINSSEVSVKPS